MSDTLLFIDTATSGLDPKKHVLLEVAVMLVSFSPGLEIIDAASYVVYHTDADDIREMCAEFHRTNGLLNEALDPVGSGIPLRQLEATLLAGTWTSASRVAGRGVDFDLKFLREHMATFAGTLPRARPVDLNEVELVATKIGGRTRFERATPRTYRAEDDISEAYEALFHYTAH